LKKNPKIAKNSGKHKTLTLNGQYLLFFYMPWRISYVNKFTKKRQKGTTSFPLTGAHLQPMRNQLFKNAPALDANRG
jgi:hypothetical protein